MTNGPLVIAQGLRITVAPLTNMVSRVAGLLAVALLGVIVSVAFQNIIQTQIEDTSFAAQHDYQQAFPHAFY